MRPINTDLTNMLAQAASPEVFRQWLYEVDAPGGTLYFAQGMVDVTFAGQVYTAAPIRHDGIEEGTTGEIGSVTLQVANLNSDMSALLELNDALRNRRVRILLVFNLADPDAYVEDIYYIDAVTLKRDFARFSLTSRMDIMDAQIAPRLFTRYFCQWRYKCRGCWKGTEGAWTPPEGFIAGDPDDCAYTPEECERHNNTLRFGGAPSVPLDSVVRT